MVSDNPSRVIWILAAEPLSFSVLRQPCAETFFVLRFTAYISRRFVWGYEQTLETPQVDLKLRWSLISERRANPLNQHKVPPTRGKNGSGGRRWCSGAMKNPRHHHNFTDWSINIFDLWVLSALINAKDYRFLAFLMCFVLRMGSDSTSRSFPFLWQPLVFLVVCNSSPIYWLSLNISPDSTVNRQNEVWQYYYCAVCQNGRKEFLRVIQSKHDDLMIFAGIFFVYFESSLALKPNKCQCFSDFEAKSFGCSVLTCLCTEDWTFRKIYNHVCNFQI